MFEKEYRINRAWGLQIGCMYSAVEKFSFTGFSDYPFITEEMNQTLLRLQDDRKNKFNFPSVHEDRELRI